MTMSGMLGHGPRFWSARAVGTAQVCGSAIRFRSLHVDADRARLYAWGDSDGTMRFKIFSSPPSFPAVDDSGSRYQVTLHSWFHSERRIEVQLEIEPSPPKSVHWLDLIGEDELVSRFDIVASSPWRTSVGPLRPTSPTSDDDHLSLIVLTTLADRDLRGFEVRQLEGLRQVELSLATPSEEFLHSLDQLMVALDDPHAGAADIPQS